MRPLLPTLAAATSLRPAAAAHPADPVPAHLGPLYLPQRAPAAKGGPPNTAGWVASTPLLGTPPQLMAVPSHFYKVWVCVSGGEGGWIGWGHKPQAAVLGGTSCYLSPFCYGPPLPKVVLGEGGAAGEGAVVGAFVMVSGGWAASAVGHPCALWRQLCPALRAAQHAHQPGHAARRLQRSDLWWVGVYIFFGVGVGGGGQFSPWPPALFHCVAFPPTPTDVGNRSPGGGIGPHFLP